MKKRKTKEEERETELERQARDGVGKTEKSRVTFSGINLRRASNILINYLGGLGNT